jgi:hypothetical protein
VKRWLNGTALTEADICSRDGKYHSWHHHGRFHGENKLQFIERLNRANEENGRILRRSKFLILTFGSAYAYRIKKSGMLVANCHKQPADLFEKIFLHPKQIIHETVDLIERIMKEVNGLNVILTVSPVRHLRDGIEENLRSKSALILSCHELRNSFENVYYFPAYELVREDLNDYRFMEKDMAHPNKMAVEYVWDKFMRYAFSAETREYIEKIDALNRRLSHRNVYGDPERDREDRALVETEKLSLIEKACRND